MFNVPFLKPQCKRAPGARLQLEGRDASILVGLGNPGDAYKYTYHNVGHLFLDYLAEQMPGDARGNRSSWKNKKLFRYAGADGITLVKTSVFMNQSGRAFTAILSRFRAKQEEALIVHDDADIKLGDYKFSFERGSAGHKGIESIMHTLGSGALYRLRIGVRVGGEKAKDFVLNQMTPEDRKTLEKTFEEIRRELFSSFQPEIDPPRAEAR